MMLSIFAAIAIPIFIIRQNTEAGLSVADDLWIFIVSGIFIVLVILQFIARGFNVTTFRLTGDTLTWRTAPIGIRRKRLPTSEITGIAIKSERPQQMVAPEGLSIYGFSVDVFDADNKRRTVKGSVRGRRHALAVAYIIAHTYGLGSVDGLRRQIEDVTNLPGWLRVFLD